MPTCLQINTVPVYAFNLIICGIIDTLPNFYDMYPSGKI